MNNIYLPFDSFEAEIFQRHILILINIADYIY